MSTITESYTILIVNYRCSTVLPAPPTPHLPLEELGPHLHFLALYVFVNIMLAKCAAALVLLK